MIWLNVSSYYNIWTMASDWVRMQRGITYPIDIMNNSVLRNHIPRQNLCIVGIILVVPISNCNRGRRIHGRVRFPVNQFRCVPHEVARPNVPPQD